MDENSLKDLVAKGSVGGYVVYMHTSPSGKSYIGMTKDYQQRCKNHKGKSNKCRAFDYAIKKYGWDNFTHIILKENISLDLANHFEAKYISTLNTIVPNGYNLRSGGDVIVVSQQTREKISESKRNQSLETRLKISISNTGKVYSDETRAKMSKSKKLMSDETRKKMSISMMGKAISNETKEKISKALTGRVHSDETKLKIGYANKGNVMSYESRRKISISKTGKTASDETRKKMSISMMGKNKGQGLGRVIPEEIRLKMSKPVVVFGIKYLSMKSAGECLNLSASVIGKRVKSRYYKYVEYNYAKVGEK